MRNRFWLAAALLLFVTISCTKPGTSGDPSGNDNYEYSDDFVLKEGVIYFDQTNAKYLVVKDEDWLVLKNDAPATLVPVVGNIVLASQSDNTPYGFMGRVSSVTETAEGKEIRAESVALDEVFEELHLEKNIDIAEQLDELVDEDGNPVEVETIDNSFWDQFDSEDEDEVKTKTEYIKEEHFTKAISLSTDFFNGSFILSTNFYAKINIERGIIKDYSIIVRSATSISGGLNFSGDANKDFSKTFRFPGAIMVGPVALKPAIVLGFGLSVEGEVSMDGPLTIGLSSTTTTWKYNTPGQTVIDKSHPVTCQATYLDCNGSFVINGRIALQFGVFGQKLLAFGIDWQPEFSIGLSGEMHMENKKIMAKDLEASISCSFGSFGAYLYSKFFSKGANDKLRVSVQTPSFSYVIPLFDKGDKHNCFKKTGTWGLSGEFGDNKVFFNVEKKGYALFKVGQEEPVSIQAAPTSASVKSADTELSFNIPGNQFDYYVRTLNIVKDDSGKEYQFYGKPVGLLISQIAVRGQHDNGQTYSFTYDDYGRLTGLLREAYGFESTNYDRISYSYSDNEIKLNWGWKNETIGLDSYGRMISYAGDNFSRSISYPSEGSVNIYEILDEDQTYTWNRNLVYSNGSLSTQDVVYTYPGGSGSYHLSYSYSGKPDDYSVDFVHTLLDDLKMHTLPPFLAFPELRNQNILSSVGGDVALSISSSFDENGRLSKFQWADNELLTAYVKYVGDSEE